MRARASLVLGLVTTLACCASGCGGSAESGKSESASADPLEAVRQAARASFDQKVLRVQLDANSPGAGFVASGLIEPRGGRFRVSVDADAKGAIPEDLSNVIGFDGEGGDTTLAEGGSFNRREPEQRCFFNPHGPVGSFEDTISVEESMRLLGAVLESLPEETKSVSMIEGPGGESLFEVSLAPSASRPRDEFAETKRRIWGSRGLLRNAGSAIVVTIGEDQTLESVEVELRHYGPYDPYADDPADGLVNDVLIRADLNESDATLKVPSARCLVME